MQSPCLNFKASPPFLGHPNRNLFPRVSCSFHGGNRNPRKPKIEKTKKNNGGDRVKVKEKENVWSVDNDVAKAESSSRSRKRGRRMSKIGKSEKDSSVLVSGAMLMEVETVLEMQRNYTPKRIRELEIRVLIMGINAVSQEPVIKPSWNTFSSSVSGWWKGVGAVFSPITAEMEPIDIGDKSENLFDCYILALVEAVASPSGERSSEIRRMINWVTLNPHGEVQQVEGRSRSKEMVDAKVRSLNFPRFESFDFESSDVLEEDFMGMEPGLVFFEVGFTFLSIKIAYFMIFSQILMYDSLCFNTEAAWFLNGPGDSMGCKDSRRMVDVEAKCVSPRRAKKGKLKPGEDSSRFSLSWASPIGANGWCKMRSEPSREVKSSKDATQAEHEKEETRARDRSEDPFSYEGYKPDWNEEEKKMSD
ncbi:hypothetical protein GIB67_012480 [Kingdonia uniflora]|uniref:Uncharacterized protein n=1 Tax=Kingdonia uniflora TaxID=39325 RepID=A0A7J7MVJ2_9MAGN|nr:hypothetical protein GIB67_012480 [Kingdonia uniflora]